MANADHVALLKQGVRFWNEWRARSQTIVPDLSAADLAGTDLRQADLSGMDLREACLSKANLTQAQLDFTYLSGANLCGADLSVALLCHATLSGAHLREADLARASLFGANLCGADLRGARNLIQQQVASAQIDTQTLLDVPLPTHWPGGIQPHRPPRLGLWSQLPTQCPACGRAAYPAQREELADGRVRIIGVSTCMGYTPFYDEHGVEHHHNPNWFSVAMTCETGHCWVARQYWQCCGDWPDRATQSG
jgi:hypothetical protein